MVVKKSVSVLLLLLVFSAGNLFAQLGAVSGVADVTIDIKPTLSIGIDGGNLDFGQILASGAGIVTKTPDQGVRFKVDGHNTGNITVTYNDASLTNASSDILTFEPDVVSTGTDPAYNVPAPVASGGQTGINGTTYIWVGGQIDASSAIVGDYAGLFTLTVAYN